MRDFISRNISVTRKRKIKTVLNKIRKRTVDAFLSYSPVELEHMLVARGIKKGDTILAHIGWSPFNGFKGSAQDAISVFKNLVGSGGNLLMVSMPYTHSTYEYLNDFKGFDVRRTRGHMGVLPEIFRRQKGVLRSLHPAHPFLVWGRDAAWFVKDHENCIFPCGSGSPAEKLLTKRAKVIFFDVPFNTMTFIHYIEHVVREDLPFALYDPKEFVLPVIDYDGNTIEVRARAFSREAVTRRRPLLLEAEMRDHNCCPRHGIGNTSLGIINVTDALGCARNMISRGAFFHAV